MDQVWEYRQVLLDGLYQTIIVFVLGAALALVSAFTIGIAGLSDHGPVRWFAVGWVEFWRGTSMLVQLFWIYFVLPFLGIDVPALVAAVLALGLNEGAYAAEIVRGTIKARPRGQTEASIALGMGKTLRMRRILIPQSIPAMLPPFGNVFVDTLKNTSLVSLVTVRDLTFQGQAVLNNTGATIAVYSTLLVIYFILSMITSTGMKWLEGVVAIDRTRSPLKVRIPKMGGGPGVGGGR